MCQTKVYAVFYALRKPPDAGFFEPRGVPKPENL